jgi:hypothetical protein
LLYKIYDYVSCWIKGYNTFPVEISAITYFLFSIVYLFKIKKLEQLAVFCALISGFFYMLFFMIFGKNFNYGSILNTYLTYFNHSLLYLGAILKMRFIKYEKTEYYKLIFFFAIIIFYSWVMKQFFTFDNFIFLYKFMDAGIIYMAFPSLESISYFLPSYYVIVLCTFLFVFKLFYVINRKLYCLNLKLQAVNLNRQPFYKPK